MNPRTSFLLPVRDGGDTLDAALRSVLAQTDGDFEVIVIDDGSTDQSLRIAEAAAREDDRVRVWARPPLGLVSALNFGLSMCRGEFVARMDCDDLTDATRLERQLPYLIAESELGVVDARVRMFRDDDEVPTGMTLYAEWVNTVVDPSDFDRELLVDSPIIHPAATFRRAAVMRLGGYRNGPFPEDYDLWLRMHASGLRLRKIPEVLHAMRDRPNRATRTDRRYSQDGLRRARMTWLEATVLATPRRLVVWGAGKEGKPWLRWLAERGHTVVAVVDVAQRRIGGTRGRGVPVVAADALPGIDAELCLVAVGARGARAEIRAELARLRPEWVEGRHWWALR